MLAYLALSATPTSASGQKPVIDVRNMLSMVRGAL
jgi:hypothetical protein